MLAFSVADFRKMPPYRSLCLSLLTPVVLAIGRAGTDRPCRACVSFRQTTTASLALWSVGT